ncbi:MAG: A/G-specific adenine glycosylase [Deltaproteobacteria bacterium]|nr:A/G-specific adenine glycosylase [Deltaproteobacteria bacterium]
MTSGLHLFFPPEVLAERVVAYYHREKRPLPFRATTDPYAVWVSEVMAQQTRIETVLPFWERWMLRFPTLEAVARAPEDEILAAWSGLGYYARARSLHKAAKIIVETWGGQFPRVLDDIQSLPGVGRYTAGAIASIAFGKRTAVVDGNVVRIYARLVGVEADVRSQRVQRLLWDLASRVVPEGSPGDFNQGLMDLGATTCTPRAPRCASCPLADLCVARKTGRQHEIPVVAPKAPPRLVAVEIAWIARKGKWLLAKRASKGLFGGLWELPEREALERAGNRLLVKGSPLAQREHRLSHRTIRYTVHTVHLAPRARVAVGTPYEDARFFPPSALASLGISSATRALARAILAAEASRRSPSHG